MSDEHFSKEIEAITRIQPEKKHGGIWVVIGLEEYRIPPLPFGSLKELEGKVELISGLSLSPSPEQIEVVFACVHAAINRNYPSITLEDVKGMLDVSNFMNVLEAVMNVSGFKRAKDKSQGEAVASSL